MEGCQPGDSLVFYFSGHGSREVDRNMDEVDGYDEAICPVDYEHEGKILDDEINATIVRPLPRGAKLHALVDTCFSGTVLDLPFMCRMNRLVSYECCCICCHESLFRLLLVNWFLFFLVSSIHTEKVIMDGKIIETPELLTKAQEEG